MEFAYGYKVGSKAFDHLNLPHERVLIDNVKRRTRLSELIEMHLRDGHGDIVHVISPAHIPQGTQRKAVEAVATIRVSPAPKEAKPAHRPAQFVPTDEQRAEIEREWKYWGNSTDGAIAKASAVMGYPVKRETLYYHFGKRS